MSEDMIHMPSEGIPGNSTDEELLHETDSGAVEKRKQAMLAGEISSEHQEHLSLGQELAMLEGHLNDVASNSRLVLAEINWIQFEIATKEKAIQGDLFRKIKEFKDIKALRDQIGTKKSDLAFLTEEKELAQQTVNEIKALHTSSLDKLTEFTNNFLTNEEIRVGALGQVLAEKQKDFESVREARDLGVAASENNCFFLHGIIGKGRFAPKENTPEALKAAVSSGAELASRSVLAQVVIEAAPEISVHSIRDGYVGLDGVADGSWGRMGLVLKGGEIRIAGPQDMATRVSEQSGKREAERVFEGGLVKSKEDVSRAVNRQFDNGLLQKSGEVNEFTVVRPEIAGIYVYAEGNGELHKYSPDTFDQDFPGYEICEDDEDTQEARQIAGQSHLPLYMISGCDAYVPGPRLRKLETSTSSEGLMDFITSTEIRTYIKKVSAKEVVA